MNRKRLFEASGDLQSGFDETQDAMLRLLKAAMKEGSSKLTAALKKANNDLSKALVVADSEGLI